MQSRKQDIIIQLGSQNIRVGLVCDRTPRKCLPSQLLSCYPASISAQQYQIKVQQYLYTVLYTHINTSCLNRTVILLEHVYTDRRILQAIVKVLFKKFKIQKVQFGLSCVTPLYLTGRFSGVVIIGGASAVQIMPVFQSYPIIKSYKYIPTGTSAMHQYIKNQLMLQNPQAKNQLLQKLTPDYLHDIKILYSNMWLVQKNSQQTVTLSMKKTKLKLKPSAISYANIFGNVENQQYNIVHMFLTMLDEIGQLGTKVLETIAGNIVLAGGIWRVKGMQAYFKKQILKQIVNYNKLKHYDAKNKIKFVNWGFNPSEVSWIGSSVGASVKAVDALCLKRTEYESQGFVEKIMAAYFCAG